ncbi:hypothetical protein [Pseudomonas sp. PS02290]|jgi:methyl-accepting chemotaxis protein|uniref:hypothetical protein n=1 Tax=Pseudomonas sp. PS02290 TaxID=2991430 RepID=UPI00249A8920|nr:hypothetical protein [Pseudomonas sp. PS02290]
MADVIAIPLFRKAADELKIIIDSNARQAGEVGQNAEDTNGQVTWAVIIGAFIAFVSALALGVFVIRLITRQLYQ